MSDYYKTKASVAEYIEMAKEVNGEELIKQLKPFLPDHSTLLELGSGPGTDWQLLAKDFKVTGSDNSNEFLHHLKTTHPEGQFLELDAVTIETNDKFEGVYSNKVLHHLQDQELRQSVLRQHDVLKPEGIICHSFWHGEGSEVFKGMFVNYHNETSLKDFFGNHFEVLLLEPYEEFEPEDSLLMIARKIK